MTVFAARWCGGVPELPPQDCDWDCLLRIAIGIVSSGLRLLPGLPPQDWVWFHQGLKSSSMTKVTFCSCLIQRCWTRVPLHSSLSPQGVNLGRQFVRLTWQWWIAGDWWHNPQMGGFRLRMLVKGHYVILLNAVDESNLLVHHLLSLGPCHKTLGFQRFQGGYGALNNRVWIDN